MSILYQPKAWWFYCISVLLIYLQKAKFGNERVIDFPFAYLLLNNVYQPKAWWFYYISVLAYALAIRLPSQDYAEFSISSIINSTIPAFAPIITGKSSRCQAFKNFFGLTYEKMQEKNIMIYESLSIDLITKNGNVKYNITSSIKRLAKILKNTQKIVILVHGFLESSDGVMVQGLSPELLKQSELKLLALDGRKIINLEYFRSTTYARFIGEILGKFLSDIIKEGQDQSKIILMGHSLGAHIAGIAGKTVYKITNQKIGRISALDPAGPCFADVNATNRLDKDDANYVDVIHTNTGILGFDKPVGHKDFYPNGGRSQPGCILATCDHTRAWQFFAESINTPDSFPARKCHSWTSFRDGRCSKNEVAFMGINSKNGSNGLYFLTTASSSPFGLGAAGSGKK